MENGNKKEIKLSEKLDEIPEVISKLNGTMGHEFSGTLPLQVLKDLTPENKEKLINNFINQDAKEYEKEMEVLRIIKDKNSKSFIIRILSIIVGIPSFLFLTWICLSTQNKDVIFEILKLLVTFLGGIGIGYSVKNSKNDNNEY